jgi:hypothetical protein
VALLRLRGLLLAAALAIEGGCSLTTDVEGLTNGAASDGGSSDGAVSSGSDGSSADSDSPRDGAPLDAAGDAGASEVGTDAPVACGSAAISVVQVNATDGMTNKATSITLGSVDAHDAIIVALAHDSTSGLKVSDTQGNAYVPVVGPFDAIGNRFWIFATFDTAGGSSGSTTVTATVDVTLQHYIEMYVHQFHGVAAFDHGSERTGVSTAVDGATSGSATLSCANELVFGFGEMAQLRTGTGFNALSTFHSNLTEYKIVTAPGMYDARASMTSGSNWVMLMAAFLSK